MSFNSGNNASSGGGGGGGRFGAFLNKAKSTAVSVGQASGAAIKDTSNVALGHGQHAFAGFSLPGESDKAAAILARFLALPVDEAQVVSPGGSVDTDPLQARKGGKLATQVRQTTTQLRNTVDGVNKIPSEVVQRAKGFAVFTILKAGFVFSGKAGSGLVVARLEDGSWSAPSCIATAGVGWGFQIGADITEVVVVLNSDDAVKAFSQGGNLQIGGTLSAAVGPVGTGAQINAALQHPAPMFSYTRSRGLFAGVSLEGTVLVERKEANRQFYGSAVSAKDILLGKVPAPEIASKMYDLLEAAEGLMVVSGASEMEGAFAGEEKRAAGTVFDADDHH